MKRRTNYLVFLGILSMGAGLLVGFERADALTYQENVGLNFTFNQSLNVALSADLVINDLTPGTSADSNVVTVTVNSNNLSGYKLGATVGSSTLANTGGAIYNTDKLIHNSYTSADNTDIAAGTFDKPIFTNITATVAALDTDNTWGYAFSLDGGTTWINANKTAGVNDTGYNGLPLYTSTPAELKATTSPSVEGGDTLQFKIAAKASTTQSSGEYNNVVNFTATAEPNPKGFYEVFAEAGKTTYNGYYKMQDMTSGICSSVAVVDDESAVQLIDVRDGKTYWVAKLQDGKCWMTQNLDLDLSTTDTLTSNDTDLTDGSLAGAYAAGYTNSGGVISWTPATSTTNAITTEANSLDSFTWPNNYHTPVSMDSGNWYWKGTYYGSGNCPVDSSTNPSYISCDYISKRTEDKNGTAVTNNWATYFSTSDTFAAHGTHDHVGNYYNWPVAIASNSSSSLNTGTDTESTVANSPKNSICPKGWRLPVATSDYAMGETGLNDFYNLDYLYNGGKTNTDTGLIGKPTYFVRGGYVWSSYLHAAGYGGYYWSSSVSSSSSTDQARSLNFSSGWVNPQNSNNRDFGRSVRCLAR